MEVFHRDAGQDAIMLAYQADPNSPSCSLSSSPLCVLKIRGQIGCFYLDDLR